MKCNHMTYEPDLKNMIQKKQKATANENCWRIREERVPPTGTPKNDRRSTFGKKRMRGDARLNGTLPKCERIILLIIGGCAMMDHARQIVISAHSSMHSSHVRQWWVHGRDQMEITLCPWVLSASWHMRDWKARVRMYKLTKLCSQLC